MVGTAGASDGHYFDSGSHLFYLIQRYRMGAQTQPNDLDSSMTKQYIYIYWS